MIARLVVYLSLIITALVPIVAAAASDAVRTVTIRAGRDVGYFAGDLVQVSIEIVVADGYKIDDASLPQPGPINYWLDLRTIKVARTSDSDAGARYTLTMTYQNFYDALDARQQEIPTFAVSFRNGPVTATANVPPWTIGVSPIREVAPAPKSDPKDYMRADAGAPFVTARYLWWGFAAAAFCAILALLALAYERAIWPFRARPARAFGEVERGLRRLAGAPDTDQRQLDALLLLHRGIDRSDGRRILADDLDLFLHRNPAFVHLHGGLSNFFAASRHAFFASDTERARARMPFKAIERLARQLSSAERSR